MVEISPLIKDISGLISVFDLHRVFHMMWMTESWGRENYARNPSQHDPVLFGSTSFSSSAKCSRTAEGFFSAG